MSKLSFRKKIDTLARDIIQKRTINSETFEMERAKLEENFLYFCEKGWVHATGHPYIAHNIVVEAVCAHLQFSLTNEAFRNLILNAPPRHAKSSVTAILFPAWAWIHKPDLAFLFISYNRDLSLDFSLKCKNFINSDWYKMYWGEHIRIHPLSNSKQTFANTKFGVRKALSFFSGIMGFGADYIFIDDPNDTAKVESEKEREKINKIYSTVISSRHKNVNTVRKFISQQRTHQKDLSGYLLSPLDTPFQQIRLPLEFEAEKRSKTFLNGEPFWEDPRETEGELLWDGHYTESHAIEQKAAFLNDPFTISAQLQQDPIASGGGLFKEIWLKNYWPFETLPKFERIIQSWDTAFSVNASACYSACTTWGIFKDPYNKSGKKNIMLLSLFKEKVEYPELFLKARELAEDFTATNNNDIFTRSEWRYNANLNNNFTQELIFKPDIIIVEEKASGYSLYQDMRKYYHNVIPFNPSKYGPKVERARSASVFFASASVYFKINSNYYNTPIDQLNYSAVTYSGKNLISALLAFPQGEGRDVVDSVSQALIYVKDNGLLTYESDNFKGIIAS